jgi:hypothetical protein
MGREHEEIVLNVGHSQASSELAWEELTSAEMDQVWDRFYAEFKFRPSIHPKDWPGILEPNPSVTYSISSFYGIGTAIATDMEKDLSVETLDALRKCVRGTRERVYALDWNHDCYWFYPDAIFRAEETDAWKVPVLPNGDYYIFLAEDFRFGIFGHPWEQTICIFGQELLDAFATLPPKTLTHIVRKNGVPTQSQAT